MSQSGTGSEEDTGSIKERLAKRSAEASLRRGLELPEEVKAKIKRLAEAQSKSEAEVLAELVVKGFSTIDEEVAYALLRHKVLSSLTLKEAKQIMSDISEVFKSWTTTPHPQPASPPTIQAQPTSQPPAEKDEFTETMNRAEKEALKGLPPVTLSPTQGQPTGGQTGLGQILLYNLGKYALGKLLENPAIGNAIGKMIEQKGGDFMEDLKKMFEEEGRGT